MKSAVYGIAQSPKALVGVYLLILAITAGMYSFFEGKAYVDALWWACVTATTVGYGDMYPASLGGRITGVFLMHSTVFIMVPLIVVHFMERAIHDRDEWNHEEQEAVKEQLNRIESMLKDK